MPFSTSKKRPVYYGRQAMPVKKPAPNKEPLRKFGQSQALLRKIDALDHELGTIHSSSNMRWLVPYADLITLLHPNHSHPKSNNATTN